MPRYIAFLRGVSPMNAKMAALTHCFALAGFSDVRTLLSSGNVVFCSQSSPLHELERRAEDAMQSTLGRSFVTSVRPETYIQDFIASEPFAEFTVAPAAKRIVIFLRKPADPTHGLPIAGDGWSILKLSGSEVLCTYIPGPKSSALMRLLERKFGNDITTRTLETVHKCAWA